jgi:hypothetical protein
VNRQPRDRVTIDLRGIGPLLHAHAVAHEKTTAALVRVAVLAMLDAQATTPALPRGAELPEERAVKVTLRLDASYAARLKSRARRAEVSQGTYVAGLLDGIPASPRSTDHGDAIAALVDSTQKVAAMSSDIHAFVRLVRNVKADEAQKYLAGLMSLSKDMRLHLETASRLMVGLSSRQRLSGPAAAARHGHRASE